jgi:TPR repeat protein
MVQKIKQLSGVFAVMSQAAKYYGLASKLGHATAMYNLGVFYVHGWGGVPVDCNRARELFVAAAEMGQVNAQEALAMVPRANDTDSTGNSTCLLS